MSSTTMSGTCTPSRPRSRHQRTACIRTIGESTRTAERSSPPRGPAIAGSDSSAGGTGTTRSLPLLGRGAARGVVAVDRVDVRLDVDLLDAVPLADLVRPLDGVLAIELADV